MCVTVDTFGSARLQSWEPGTKKLTVINNKINGLDVVKWELIAGRKVIQMIVQNISSLPITEVIVALGGFDVKKTFWGLSRGPLQPGDSITLEYAYANLPAQVTIEAIVFENGSGEGDKRRLKNSLNYRIGFREELHRAYTNLSKLSEGGLPYRAREELLQSVIAFRQEARARQIAADSKSLSDDDEFWIEAGRRAGALIADGQFQLLERVLSTEPDTGNPPEQRYIISVSRALTQLMVAEKRLASQIATPRQPLE